LKKLAEAGANVDCDAQVVKIPEKSIDEMLQNIRKALRDELLKKQEDLLFLTNEPTPDVGVV